MRCWCEGKVVQLLWKTVWQLLRKSKLEVPRDPAVPLVGMYPKELIAGTRTDICTRMFIALFTIAER